MLRHPGFRDPPRAMLLGALAHAMHFSGLSRAGRALLRSWLRPGYIRGLAYHSTPVQHAESFRRQLAFYRRHFVPVGQRELDELLVGRRWAHSRPGLLISFDDGLRNNFDVAAPLLEEYGFTGWFFVPTDFISLAPEAQAAFAASHRITAPQGEYADGRVAMNWDEVRTLDRRHVVGCHTRRHCPLGAGLTATALAEEILGSKQRLEAELGHPMPHFCWVGGEERTYSAPAAREIRAAGYRFGFMTNCAPTTCDTPPLQIQRTNVEAAWPLPIVTFQLSGMLDLLYTPKRRRVNRLTATS